MTISNNHFDPAALRQLLRYEPDTGKLFWLERTADVWPSASPRQLAAWNRQYAATEAFKAIGSAGYPMGRLFGREYLAHRVIMALVNGVWPVEVDHIDGNRKNNRWTNLREVTRRENVKNRRRGHRNKSGTLGVYWAPHAAKWRAEIKDGSARRHLGYFTSKPEAVAARKRAEQEHGYHPNHGGRA